MGLVQEASAQITAAELHRPNLTGSGIQADLTRRGAGVVDRGGLENRCARKRTEGSNPSPSASYKPLILLDF